MSECDLVVLRDADAVAAEAACRLRDAACRAIEAEGRFLLGLAGGTTPARLYELLAGGGWNEQLPWERTLIFWSDERCVPPAHPDSNFGLAERILLRHVDVPPRQVHRMRGELGAVAGAAAYTETLDTEVGPAGLDLVLLGVGADGHTASLFPGTSAGDGDSQRHRRAAPAAAPDGSPRITLTLRELNAACEVLFLVTGEGKREVMATICGPGNSTSPGLPAGRVRPARPPTWLIDRPAAAGLRS